MNRGRIDLPIEAYSLDLAGDIIRAKFAPE